MMRRAMAVVLACLIGLAGGSAAHAAQHPFFSFEFDDYDGRGAPHTDTHKITALKPVRSLVLSVKSNFVNHLPSESAVLLDLNGVTILDQKNDAQELSISLVFPGDGLLGSFAATKVTFDDVFHDTVAASSGTFVDGTTFVTSSQVGFVPEPATGAMALAGLVAMALKRSAANRVSKTPGTL